jgi:hypothetical protein
MKRFAVLVVSFTVLGCQPGEKVSGPTGPVEAVSFAFCGFFRPSWMAVQNEGDVWKQVTVPASGPLTLDATAKVSLAMTFSFLGNFTLILNVTRDELEGSLLAPLGCEEDEFGDREIAGTVSGLVDGDVAVIHAGPERAYGYTDGQQWAVQFLTNTPVDVVAVRMPQQVFPDRLIVRRGVQPQVAPPTPQTATTLNFAAADAVVPETQTLTVNGVGTSTVAITGTFITANGTEATLTNDLLFADGSLDYYTVPAALRTSSDLHHLDVYASSNDGERAMQQWFDAPASKTVTLGPVVSAPTITTVGTAPIRMKALVPAQSEYPTAAGATFVQFEQVGDDFDIRFVQITTTVGFLGGLPTEWDLTIPDLSGAGYQADWGLKVGPEVEWQVDVLGATGVAIFQSAFVNGATIATSTRFSPSFSVVSPYRTEKRPRWQPFGSSHLLRRR